VGDFRTAVVALQYPKCKGNYVVDADDNVLLDMFGQIASISVGYRNEELEAVARTEEFAMAAMNRPALGVFPPADWRATLDAGLLKESVRPRGLSQIFTANCGSTANESAYKACFMAYMHRKRGHSDFDQKEMASSMDNAAPGAPTLSMLSFKTGFHGRLFGSLSTTRSKPIHKLDIPAFDWPAVDWPALRYPLEQHEAENRKEEERVIALVEETIEQWEPKAPVAAIVVEPIQSEGGDNHASPHFFRRLREVTKQRGVYMIVDEVQTGVGATGTFWAHEKWNLPTPPDAVSFSKKMQAAGYYHTEELRPSAGYRNFNVSDSASRVGPALCQIGHLAVAHVLMLFLSLHALLTRSTYQTWMGDPARAIQAREIIRYIEANSLVSHTASMGELLYSLLASLSSRYPTLVQNLRGKTEGTFQAFDCQTGKERDALVAGMRKRGVLVGGSGERAVRLRPLLIFGEQELGIFAETLEATLKEMA
jgi:4-aminobutyrate aminotransferase/(S)-3-amino-2-methylpropionate transaminase